MTLAALTLAAWLVAAATASVPDLSPAVSDILTRCPLAGAEECARTRLARALGPPGKEGEDSLVSRLEELFRENDLVVALPEDTKLVFRAGRGIDFDVEAPEERGRDMMKHKMLLPLLMLIKLKLKAITPILLALVGLKALKALIMSKIAIMLVVGFLIVQLCQKLGMAKMSMMPAAAPAPDPTPVYGAPTTSGYEPSGWEPAGGPYSRVYSTDAQQLAYSSYMPKH